LKGLISLLIHRFIPEPSNNLLKIKTFEKNFTVQSELINTCYETHSLISVCITEIIKGSPIVADILINIVKVCPWITFSLLNFPINKNNQLLSFASCLIDSPDLHVFFRLLIKQCKGCVRS
jgi:hypothetical protein